MAPDSLTLGYCGRISVAVFVCLDMVKTTHEGENHRRSPRLARSTSPRLREEEQVDFASQTCSPGSMEGDTSVDPTSRPNSNFMVPSQQPALTLLASSATEDLGSQLPSSAIATEDQVACIKSTSTCIDKSIASSSSTAFKYIYPLFSAPTRGSLHSSDEPKLARKTRELCSPPVASINPAKMDAAPSATTGPPGNPRGSDGSTGNGRRSGSETRSLRTTTAKMDAAPSATAGPPANPRGRDGPTGNARQSGSETRSLRTISGHKVTLGSGASTASMPGRILDRGTDDPTRNGRRSGSETRSLWTASVHGVILGTKTATASMLSEILGRGTSRSKDNPRGHDRSRLLETVYYITIRESSGKRWSIEGESFRHRARFGRTEISLEQLFSQAEARYEFVLPNVSPCCPHQAITLFRKTCQSPRSHIS